MEPWIERGLCFQFSLSLQHITLSLGPADEVNQGEQEYDEDGDDSDVDVGHDDVALIALALVSIPQ